MSFALLTAFTGPAALGRTSKSKICVGNQSVAQAFGMSTTPLMWPCTGAVPRMAYAWAPRTVNKHLEHIFEKLGVETRTAAAALAASALDGVLPPKPLPAAAP